MNYEKRSQELDMKIRSIQEMAPLDCYIADGVVNIERWRKQQVRPLFIGKEAYEKGDRNHWSINTWLNDKPQEACNASPRTWQTTAYVSYALQNGISDYDSLPSIWDGVRAC